MKTITPLVLIQFVVLLIVAIKLFHIEQQLQDLKVSEGGPVELITQPIMRESISLKEINHDQKAVIAPTNLKEMDLRRILREELANSSIETVQPLDASNDQMIEHKIADNDSYTQRYELAVGSLDEYIFSGRISRDDLDQFHSRISQLNVTDRREMLVKFSRAVNSGEINLSNQY